MTARELYRYLPTAKGRVAIENLHGGMVVKTETDLLNLLAAPDLHYHLREMYQTALDCLRAE